MPQASSEPTHIDEGSHAWRSTWRVAFAIAKRSGPVLWALADLHVPTYWDGIVRIDLIGSRSGQPRPILVALIDVGGRWYVGNPNGQSAWLTNLGSMETATLTRAGQSPVSVHPVPLALGPERDAVARATAHHGPIHVRPLYWASSSHVRRAGVFYRLDRLAPTSSSV
jgi:hypothetical protein